MDDRAREIARLWTLAHPTVSAFVSSIVLDFGNRDDVMQEIAVAVIDSFEHYDPGRPFGAWAIGVARNQVRNYLRRHRRDRHVFDSSAMDQIAHAFAELESTVSARSGYLNQCIEQLESRSRQLCELRYRDGQQPAAISKTLEMSANAVAKALQRVREQLRKCIERKLAVSES